jgi:hypothetical protein
MNPVTQFDLHPDAENLNAFVEHVLPEAEQAQVLKHLADCSRCREVVYLAQESATAEGAQAAPAVANAPTARAPRAWFAGWRIAWVPAAVFAALVTMAVWVHFRQAPVADVAKVLTRGEGETGKQVPPQLGQVTPESMPVHSATALPQEKRSKSAQSSLRVREFSGLAVPRAAAPTGAGGALPSTSGRNFAQLQPLAQQQVSITPSRFQAPSPGPSPPQQQQQQQVQQQAAGTVAGASSDAKALPEAMKSASQSAPVNQTVSVSAEAVQVETEPVSSAQLETLPLPVAEAKAVQKKAVRVPSGLPVISTVAAQNRLLAIDAGGMLFLSEDAGKTWQSVAPQWTGHAMRVRVAPAVHSYDALVPQAGVGGAPERSVAKTPAPVVFEVENDSRQVWVSVDGKTWKAKE